MSHNVTATKYRPQSFLDLEGQEFVSVALKNSLEKKNIANAFLLSGPRGVGKTSTARILAKGLNCINGPTGFPCNKCEHCQSITSGNNSDVIEIDGASNTSINDIKVIQEEILYPPVNSRYKVYIIDEVHMLSKSAFNALLKTIEEPPENVVFIFATTEINEVPATIKSRCQQFNLRLIPEDIIFKNLKKILSEKNIKHDDDSAKWIAREANGSMRDAYTLLDQIISFCDNEITLSKIFKKFGFAGEEKISNLVKKIISKNISSIYNELSIILETGISPEQIIQELIKYFKNILLLKSDISLKKEIELNPIFYSDDITSNFSLDDIENILEISFQTFEKTRYSIDIRTEIEIFLLKLSKYKEFIRPRQIINELNLLKNALISGEKISLQSSHLQSHENTLSQTGNINLKESVTKPIPPKLSISSDKSDILKTLKSRFQKTNFEIKSALDNVEKIEEENNIITLYFNKEMSCDIANNNLDILNKELSNIVNESFVINNKFIPDVKKETSISNAATNTENIIKIFNGIEIK